MTMPEEPDNTQEIPNVMPPLPPTAPTAPEWYEGQGVEHTQQLPYSDVTPAPTKPFFSRRTGIAAIIVAAVLAGGAAGAGGAAWAHAWSDDDTTSATSNSAITVAPAGSVAASDLEQVAAKVLPSVVEIKVTGRNSAGSGSGIVLNSDGMILTNNHVVVVAGNGGTISVSTNDGHLYKATLIGTDPITDSAVIQAPDLTGVTPATMGRSSSLRVGQTVLAIGSPFGLSSTVTHGIVSALNRPVEVSETQTQDDDPFGFGQQQQASSLSATYPAIQTDAPINPGNSGGALVDLKGNVVGMNSSIYVGSSGSSGSVGLGFAIPIDELLPIINQITHHQTPTHARLGVSVKTSPAAPNATQLGAVVATVDANGAAKGAGIAEGDLITKVDDTVITDGSSLVATIRGHRPGDHVTLTYIRNGQTHTVKVTLGSDEATQAS